MIIALDPGVTTGVAILDSQQRLRTYQDVFSHKSLMEYLEDLSPTTVVYESFVYQRRNKVELYPVEVIGVIRLYAQKYDIPLYVQSASQAKGFITNDKIEAMGLWVKGQKHGMDALRHLLYHQIITKGDRTWLDKLKQG